MAYIKPFRGILYNQNKIGNLKDIVSPPYDVISKKMQAYYYDLSPYNIVRLILGKKMKKDTRRFNEYTRAGNFLRAWLKKKILVKDKKPVIYIYKQVYLHQGEKRIRTGFIALMKIEDPHRSNILPHEYTLDKPKADRLNLIKEVKANLSPIFSLYYDKTDTLSRLLKKYIKDTTPIIDIDVEGVTHQFWRLQEKKPISFVKRMMKNKKIFIADGHHRYEVALMYKNMMSKWKEYNKNVNFVMMYFTNLHESRNVTILSTHRLLKDLGGLDKKKILVSLRRCFEISTYRNLDKLLSRLAKERRRPSFGTYFGDKIYFLLRLKKDISVSEIMNCKGSSCWKRLDVTVLHNFILKDLLTIKDSENNVKYVRDAEHVVKLVDDGQYKIAFFLNPTRIYQVKEVAERRDMMPQKSTYFYPKLLSGLVINRF